MIEVDASNAGAFLRDRDRGLSDGHVQVVELAGGVSNVILLVTLQESGERYVLKQARGRLRVKEEWFCPVERVWREVEVLRICGELLQLQIADCRLQNEQQLQCCVPRVLWEDRDNYLYAMTAAPEGHRTWKELLLAGETEASVGIAKVCGSLLARLHAGSWKDQAIAARLDDRTYFDQLRVDPYYRQIGRVHPELAPQVQRLIESVWENRCCLVHGDFSPKNLLVWPGHVMLIDFEVGHYGDPAFDLGFFLTHLILKAIWSGTRRNEYLELVTAFWNAYRSLFTQTVAEADAVGLERRMLANIAGCMLARVDGKSPVDYLSAQHREVVRQRANLWMRESPLGLASAIGTLQSAVLSTEY